MKKTNTKYLLALGLVITMLASACTCSNCSCDVTPKADSLIVKPQADPTNPAGPYDTSLTPDDLELLDN